MKNLLMCICSLLLASCAMQGVESKSNVKQPSHLARITYYHPQSPYGSKVASPNAKKAVEGVTVAAHPDFKFGTKIFIPDLKGTVGDGVFVVQDRGSAVTKKKAAKGRAYVVDVFVNTRSKLEYLAKTKPEYMRVYIILPTKV